MNKKHDIEKVRDRVVKFLYKTYNTNVKEVSIERIEEAETLATSFRIDLKINGLGLQDTALAYIEDLFRANFFVSNIVIVRNTSHFAIALDLDPVKTYKTETRYISRPLSY